MEQAVITLGQGPSQRMRRRELLFLLGGAMTAAPAVRALDRVLAQFECNGCSLPVR